MAQIVHVEPGDVLIIGQQDYLSDSDRGLIETLKELLGVAMIVVMAGPVDLGVIRKKLDEGAAHAVAGG